ncbi:hypothetical protein ACP4OV_021477 [Aristida adscensionis]
MFNVKHLSPSQYNPGLAGIGKRPPCGSLSASQSVSTPTSAHLPRTRVPPPDVRALSGPAPRRRGLPASYMRIRIATHSPTVRALLRPCIKRRPDAAQAHSRFTKPHETSSRTNLHHPKASTTMEAEAFPIRFTRGVRAYWRRRKYHRLAAAADGGKATQQRLGAARRSGGAAWGAVRRLRVRVRVLLAAPRRALARARDAYVGGMLALARKASAVALPGGPDSVWSRRVPRRKQLPAAPAGQPTAFERRLILEIYKSIVASKELTTMLHCSTAHLPAPAPGVGHPPTHLLDM